MTNTEKLLKQMIALTKLYEAKLKEVLSSEEFAEFNETAAQALFIDEMSDHPDPDFKKFVFDNLDKIFGKK